MNADLLLKALTPGHSSDMLLRDMRSDAASTVIDQLAAALVRQSALELADALEGELAKAQAAAAEPLAALDAATKARAKEENSVLAALAAHFKRKTDGTAAPGEREPERDSPKLKALKGAESAAEQAAFPATNAVTIIKEQIDGLRACPLADPATLATISMALVGGRLEACPPKKAQGGDTP